MSTPSHPLCLLTTPPSPHSPSEHIKGDCGGIKQQPIRAASRWNPAVAGPTASSQLRIKLNQPHI